MNEYAKLIDEIIFLNPTTKIVFISKLNQIAEKGNKRVQYFYNEYKTSPREEASVTIRRKISYNLAFEFTISGEKTVAIIPLNNMEDLLQKLSYICRVWMNPADQATYGMIGEKLILNNPNEFINLQCMFNKVVRFRPIVEEDMYGKSHPACQITIDNEFPTLIHAEQIQAAFYCLSHFDILNYANTSISFVSLMREPYNRTSFVNSAPDPPKITSTGKAGRTFKNNNRII